MRKKTSQDVIDSFESTFQDKFELSPFLEMQWFKDALAQYALEIKDLHYDIETDTFPEDVEQYQITTLGLMMKRAYCARELSRINKIQNIVGKDISLTGTGDQKRVAMEELEFEQSRIEDLLNKQKTHCYA